MECYAVELVHECDEREAPMLPSIPCTYILTMHERETFPWLHGVARRTYVQRNRGFRACAKTRHGDGGRVDASNQDLIHAYRAVFERERLTAVPVLVFEDDARLVSRTARRDLARVDRFVATTEFSVYTLGSLGPTVPYEGGEHWRFVGGVFSFTHAVIYSPSAVRAILGATPGPREHIDGKMVCPMPRKFTYHRPIAYQVMDVRNKSENSGTWCLQCDGGVLDSAVRTAAWAYFVAVGLDTEKGWRTMYTVNKLVVPLGCVLATLAVVTVALLLWRRRRRALSRKYP
jgi:hypothetical protein